LVTARLIRRPGGAARLRDLLDSGQVIVAPGAFDPLSARLVEEAGFPAVYMTGFGTSAALIGRPDVGLLTMTEMVDNATRISACVDIPVIADADTGYGNPLNVIRTVAAYEAAGLSGKEDPPTPAPRQRDVHLVEVPAPAARPLGHTGCCHGTRPYPLADSPDPRRRKHRQHTHPRAVRRA
jgi:hypothetical protein